MRSVLRLCTGCAYYMFGLERIVTLLLPNIEIPCPMTILAVSDPWQPYAAKPKPVPEPGAYGAILLLVMAVGILAWRHRSGRH